MWNGTMFVDLDWPLNASSLLSASAELLVFACRRPVSVCPSVCLSHLCMTMAVILFALLQPKGKTSSRTNIIENAAQRHTI